jgi:hypothetical protein
MPIGHGGCFCTYRSQVETEFGEELELQREEDAETEGDGSNGAKEAKAGQQLGGVDVIGAEEGDEVGEAVHGDAL